MQVRKRVSEERGDDSENGPKDVNANKKRGPEMNTNPTRVSTTAIGNENYG